MRSRNRSRNRTDRGFTIFEALIAIAIAASTLAVYTAVLTSAAFLRRAQPNVQAANFVQEELDTLRSLPFAELLDRANGNFLGVAMTRGPWRVKTAAGAPSGSKVYDMETAQAAINQETGLAVLPGNYAGDFTFIAKVNALASSPTGWGAGIAFRYRDAENHYRLRFTSGGIALDKAYHGTVTTVWSQSQTYATGAWYTLEVDAAGNAFTLKKNGATLTTYTDASPLPAGDLAVMALSGAKTQFDDVSVTTGGATSSWNFDANADGSVPSDWQRLSVVDLPNGAGTLTIANYQNDATIKKATATASWTDSGGNHALSGVTLISKY